MSLHNMTINERDYIEFPNAISPRETEKLLAYISKMTDCAVSYEMTIRKNIDRGERTEEYRLKNACIIKDHHAVQFELSYNPEDYGQGKPSGLQFMCAADTNLNRESKNKIKMAVAKTIEKYFF